MESLSNSTYPSLENKCETSTSPDKKVLLIIVHNEDIHLLNEEINKKNLEGFAPLFELNKTNGEFFQIMAPFSSRKQSDGQRQLNVAHIKLDNFQNCQRDFEQLAELDFQVCALKQIEDRFYVTLARYGSANTEETEHTEGEESPLDLFKDRYGNFVAIREGTRVIAKDSEMQRKYVGTIVDICKPSLNTKIVRVRYDGFSPEWCGNIVLNVDNVTSIAHMKNCRTLPDRSVVENEGVPSAPAAKHMKNCRTLPDRSVVVNEGVPGAPAAKDVKILDHNVWLDKYGNPITIRKGEHLIVQDCNNEYYYESIIIEEGSNSCKIHLLGLGDKYNCKICKHKENARNYYSIYSVFLFKEHLKVDKGNEIGINYKTIACAYVQSSFNPKQTVDEFGGKINVLVGEIVIVKREKEIFKAKITKIGIGALTIFSFNGKHKEKSTFDVSYTDVFSLSSLLNGKIRLT